MSVLSLPLQALVAERFTDLGGLGDANKLRPGAWDLAFEGLVVELDEELHFNRYRAATLATDWPGALPWQESYVSLCETRESGCLAAGRWGKRWTNPSCEAMFGSAGTPGEFADAGAPRWKQRAIYDALKDAAALTGHVRLARVSIYDEVDGVEVESLLRSERMEHADGLLDLVKRRTLQA